MDNKQVGLVGIADTIVVVNEEKNSLLIYVLVGGGACIGTALFCCLCQYCILKRRKNNRDKKVSNINQAQMKRPAGQPPMYGNGGQMQMQNFDVYAPTSSYATSPVHHHNHNSNSMAAQIRMQEQWDYE